MLVLGSRLYETPVMSLQTGTRLAHTARPLIDPTNLKIVAYEVDGPLLTEHPSFLRTADIREMSGIGMIIDSTDELLGLHDVIKVEELYGMGNWLIGKAVINTDKQKLGKIEDYSVDTGSFMIQQLNVKRGLLRGITETGLLVHRTQIVEINDDAIIIKSTKKKLHEPVMKSVRHEYVNPFRNPAPQPEAEA
ncbi:MAG: PRC-barrel domain-containing protein [Candidatus Microsaccharimonas sp.]